MQEPVVDATYIESSETLSPEGQLAHTPGAREWWEPWRFVPPLMLALACVGLFYLPVFPVIKFYLSGLLILISAINLYIYIHSRKILRSALRTAQAASNIAPSRLRKQSANTSLNVQATIIPLLFGGALPWIFPYKHPLLTYGIILYLSLALLLSVVFAIYWRKPLRPWLGRFTEKVTRPGRAALFLSVVVGVVFVGFGVFIFSLSSANAYKGEAASWPSLLHFAQEQAASVSPAAVMADVSALHPYDIQEPYSIDDPLILTFYFAEPFGTEIKIEVLDSNPPRLLSLDPDYPHRSNLPFNVSERKVRLREYEEFIPMIKLSPREIFSLTFDEGVRFQQEAGVPSVRPEIDLRFDDKWQDTYGIPAGWTISYWAATPDYSNVSALFIMVDPTTGAIIDRRYDR